LATGPSTTQSPYLVPNAPGVSFTSVISSGDAVGTRSDGVPYRFVGVPDGIGAYDNGDGTITVLVNHEIGTSTSNVDNSITAQGIVREHGSAGGFVSRLKVDKQTLQVRDAEDLAERIFLFNTQTGQYEQGTTVFQRLCSGDLPDVSAFFDAASNTGTQSRIYMTGEETGPPFTPNYGRPFAFVATGPEAGQHLRAAPPRRLRLGELGRQPELGP